MKTHISFDNVPATRFQIEADGKKVRYYEDNGKYFRDGKEIPEKAFSEACPILIFCSPTVEEFLEDNICLFFGYTAEEARRALLHYGFWEEDVDAIFTPDICDAWNDEMNS